MPDGSEGARPIRDQLVEVRDEHAGGTLPSRAAGKSNTPTRTGIARYQVPIKENQMNRRIFPVLAAGLLASGFTMAAAAAGRDAQPPRQVVSYSDLDLSKESGRQKLEQRIRRAARQVCPSTTSGSARASAEGRACVREAVSQAWVSVQEQQRLAGMAIPQGHRG